MKPHNAEQLYKINLRINRDLLDEIRRAAERESRSVNNYITTKLLNELMPHTQSKKK